MSIALVHDWLLFEAGAEKVLAEIAQLFPAPIYTLFSKKKTFAGCPVHTSFLNPGQRFYRHLLPLYPRAIQSFDLSKYDLIFSSSHAVAKGVRKQKGQRHICYCHTPMRYIWDLEEEYRQLHGLNKGWKKPVIDAVFSRLRKFDRQASVDLYIANSQTVAERIKRIYKKPATVIYPPVDIDRFPLVEKKEDYYLAYSRLVPYKRIDLVIRAFAAMPEKKLLVMGDGPKRKEWEAMATSNVTFVGWQKDPAPILAKARALIFPVFEDFGIIPVEAQSCGTPVIAFGKGGALETVIENETGLFFDQQTPESIIQALKRFEQVAFDPSRIRINSIKFGRNKFVKKINKLIFNENLV